MPVQIREYEIPFGDAGIDATVRAMLTQMHQDATLPVVQATAQEIQQAEPRGGYYTAAAIRAWVAERWHFVDDPRAVELLYGAEPQLAAIARTGRMSADCDDAAILAGALALACGLHVRVICVGFLTNTAPFTHTWVEVRPALGARDWLECDVTRPLQAAPIHGVGRAAAWS